MSRQFEDMFDNGDLTDADHIKQLIHPLEDLESGQALYRGGADVTNTGATYEVGFQASDTTTPNGYYLNSISPGQKIVFKANVDSQTGAALQVTLEGGVPVSGPLQVGNTQIGAGDIVAGQIVVAIYNDEGGGRFDVVGIGGSGSGGGGASALDDLTDVTITGTPATNEFLKHDGTDFTNVGPSDVRTALNVPTNSDLTTGLAGKQDQDPALDEISGLTMTKGDIIVHNGTGLSKLDSPGAVNDGHILSANSSTTEGIEWVAPPTGGGGGASALDDLTDVTIIGTPATDEFLKHDGTDFTNVSPAAVRTALNVPTNSDLTTGLAGKSDVGHIHPISDVTNLQNALDAKQDDLTGTADVPGLDTALSGKQETSEKGQPNGYASLDGSGQVPMSQLPSSGMGANQLDELSDVTITGTPATDEFLKHDGTDFKNVGPAAVRTALDVPTNSDLTSGLSGKADATHTHDASDIASGTLPVNRGGTGGATAGAARTSLDVPSNADLTSGLAGKADSVHTHDTSDIVSGNLPVARGGTGAGTASAARTSLDVPSNADLSSGLAGKSDVSHTHDAADIDSGVFPIARGGTGGASAGAARTSLDVPSNSDLTSGLAGKSDLGHTHAASDITSGEVALNRGGTGADLSATGGVGQVLKQSSTGGTISVGALTPGEMPSGIDASKIGSGNVSDAEFEHLDGVTGSIQAQIDSHTNDIAGKEDSVSGSLLDLKNLDGSLTSGGMFSVNATGNVDLLPKGSDGEILQTNSAASNGLGVEWVSPSSLGGGDTSISYAFAFLNSQPGSSANGGGFTWDLADSFANEMSIAGDYVEVQSGGVYRITLTATMTGGSSSAQCTLGLGINTTAMDPKYNVDHYVHTSVDPTSASGTWLINLQANDRVHARYTNGQNVAFGDVAMTVEKLQPSAISYETLDVSQVPVGNEGDVLTTVSGQWSASAPSGSEFHYVKRWRNYDGNREFNSGTYYDFNESDHYSETIGTHLSISGNNGIAVNQNGYYEISYSVSGYTGVTTGDLACRIVEISGTHVALNSGGDSRFRQTGNGQNNNYSMSGQTIVALNSGDVIGLNFMQAHDLYTITLMLRYLGPI